MPLDGQGKKRENGGNPQRKLSQIEEIVQDVVPAPAKQTHPSTWPECPSSNHLELVKMGIDYPCQLPFIGPRVKPENDVLQHAQVGLNVKPGPIKTFDAKRRQLSENENYSIISRHDIILPTCPSPDPHISFRLTKNQPCEMRPYVPTENESKGIIVEIGEASVSFESGLNDDHFIDRYRPFMPQHSPHPPFLQPAGHERRQLPQADRLIKNAGLAISKPLVSQMSQHSRLSTQGNAMNPDIKLDSKDSNEQDALELVGRVEKIIGAVNDHEPDVVGLRHMQRINQQYGLRASRLLALDKSNPDAVFAGKSGIAENRWERITRNFQEVIREAFKNDRDVLILPGGKVLTADTREVARDYEKALQEPLKAAGWLNLNDKGPGGDAKTLEKNLNVDLYFTLIGAGQPGSRTLKEFNGLEHAPGALILNKNSAFAQKILTGGSAGRKALEDEMIARGWDFETLEKSLAVSLVIQGGIF